MPDFSAFVSPENKYRKKVYKLLRYRNYFDNFIMMVIFGNIITMCMTYDGESEEYTSNLKTLNHGFVLVFLLECMLKVYGLGLYPYLYTGANKFDLFLVILSIGDFVMD